MLIQNVSKHFLDDIGIFDYSDLQFISKCFPDFRLFILKDLQFGTLYRLHLSGKRDYDIFTSLDDVRDFILHMCDVFGGVK